MDKLQKTIEQERIVNLVRGFGWVMTKEEVEGEVLRLTIEKKLESPPGSESEA